MLEATLAGPIDSAAEQLQRVINGAQASSAQAVAQQLQAFADQYATTDRQRDEALLLALDSHALEAAEWPDLQARLLATLQALCTEHRAQGGMAAVAERLARQARLSEQLKRAAPAPALAFSCQGLRKSYPGGEFSFGDLNLTLRAGEITGVVGQNGHGKTTMLRMVAGELRQDSGTLAYPLFGQTGPRIDWVRVKSELAYVPQELPAWHGALADSLHYHAAMHGVLGAENEREVAFIVERLNLAEHLGKRWAHLAGGYKLRFALAKALLGKPRLLVMDEPLANLDQKAKGLLLQDVRELARSYKRPMAVLMSSHDLQGLEAVCSQMVFLKNGRVDYVGSADGIGQGRADNEYEIGTPLTLDELRQRLAGSPVSSLREEGLNAVLVTPREVGRTALLQLLLDRGVDVHQFRDNSRSVRRLFD
jgi:ABC-2 type transport system ATP-binding protein